MTRALHILPHDGIGGVEIAARRMAADESANRFRLLFVAGRGRTDAPTAIHAPFASPLDPRAWAWIADYARSWKPDVIIGSLWKSVPATLAAARATPGSKLAWTVNLDRPAHRVDALAGAMMARRADALWADSQATLDARVGGDPRGLVIPFVFRQSSPPPSIDRSGPRFTAWGRLHRQKGFDRALELVALLRAKGVDARFDLYGPDDGERRALEQHASTLGLADSFALHGPVEPSTLPAIAANASFFLQLSRAEGMGIAVVEAMQLGLVPVVTPVGELARYVRDGDNGLIADPADLAATATRLAALLGDEPRLAAMRAAAIATWTDAPDYRTSLWRAIEALAGQPAANRLVAR